MENFFCTSSKTLTESFLFTIQGGNFLNQRTEVKAPLSKLRNLASAIADGDYSFRISVADPAKSKLFGCLEMQMKIKVEK